MGVYRTKLAAYDPRNPDHYAPLLDAVDTAVLAGENPEENARKILRQNGVAFSGAAKWDVVGYVEGLKA